LYASGNAGTIINSIDGGNNWTIQPNMFSGSNLSLFAIHFPTAGIGYAAGNYGQILKTTNGGAGIDEVANHDLLSISPNPANDFVQVLIESNLPDQTEISIYDMYGRLLSRTSLNKAASSGPIKIEISGLNNGVYLVCLSSSRINTAQKLIIQH